MTAYDSYARRVVKGKVVVGELVRLACQRYLNDRKRKDLIFRPKVVARALDFIGLMRHFKGRSAGKPFVLEPWQQFVVANILGFYWRETGDRRFTSSYIEVARKNGKTALAAALCMYFLIADGEPGAEVDLAANSKDQAKVAFEFCSTFTRQLDPKQKLMQPYRDNILIPSTNSALKVFAADDSRLDGFNASFGLIDEYHAAKNSKVRDVIKSSMTSRQNPHLATITTAGFDKTLPCYQLRSTGVDIVSGIKEDDSIFVLIYSLDENDDWTDEKVWVKSSPNLNVTVAMKNIRESVVSAKNNPSEEVGVKTKTLNVWCDAEAVWLPDVYIVKATADVDLLSFSGWPCYCGVDLSSTGDLTAVSYCIPAEDKYYFKTHYYLPESCLSDKFNREKYRLWRQLGMLTITSGNVVDYDYITNDIVRYREAGVDIQAIAYDRWNATQWAIKCTELGLPLMEYSQSLGNFNKPTKEMERLMLSGRAVIDNNEITRWCFANVQIKADYNDNIKPTKAAYSNKIDGVIAMIESLGIYLDNPNSFGSIV